MAEQEEEALQKEQALTKQKEIKNDLNTCALEIKNLLESLISLMGKENFTVKDLDSSFEMADEIDEKSQGIVPLLIDLKDNFLIE
jgi:hypothetical protein